MAEIWIIYSFGEKTYHLDTRWLDLLWDHHTLGFFFALTGAIEQFEKSRAPVPKSAGKTTKTSMQEHPVTAPLAEVCATPGSST